MKETTRAGLSDDQRAVLDLVAELALRGYRARPQHIAYVLDWKLERVTVVLEELVALEMIDRPERRPS
jgi:hypothetical protein